VIAIAENIRISDLIYSFRLGLEQEIGRRLRSCVRRKEAGRSIQLGPAPIVPYCLQRLFWRVRVPGRIAYGALLGRGRRVRRAVRAVLLGTSSVHSGRLLLHGAGIRGAAGTSDVL
jgi:hypothetical protein